jgi:predicted secreted protein
MSMKLKMLPVLAAVVLTAATFSTPAEAKPFFRGAIAKGVKHLVKEVGKHPAEAVFVAAAVATCVGGCTVVIAPAAAP